MTSLQSQLGGGSDAGATAEELAEGQRSISIAEFFEKNKQMLGFDSDAKALVTAVKEAVDNSLTWSTPFVYRSDGETKHQPIGEAVDDLIQSNREDVRVKRSGDLEKLRVENLEALSFDDEYDLDFRRISSVFRHRVNSDIYRITVEGRREVELTDYHSVFVLRDGEIRSVETSDIDEDDYVVLPDSGWSGEPTERIDLLAELLELPPETTEPVGMYGVEHLIKRYHEEILEAVDERYRMSDFRKWDRLPLGVVRELDLDVSEYEDCKLGYRFGGAAAPAVLDVTHELAELLGLYAAEGCVTGNRDGHEKVYLSLGSHESDLIQYTESLVESVFSLPASTVDAHETATNVTIPSKMVGLLLKEVFEAGTGASKKRVPRFVFDFPPRTRERFLLGYGAGDGYPTEDVIRALRAGSRLSAVESARITFGTTSERLASGLRYLCSSLDYDTTQERQPGETRTIDGREAEFDESYLLHLRTDQSATSRQKLPADELVRDVEDPKLAYNLDGRQTRVESDHALALADGGRLAFRNDGRRIAAGDLTALPVTDIERIDYEGEWVYDVSVPGDENFMAGTAPLACHNSLDATEEAGFLPDIYVEIEDRGDYYRLVVEDNGPGITKDEVPKVFGKLLYGSRFHAREQSLTPDQRLLVRRNGNLEFISIGRLCDAYLPAEGEATGPVPDDIEVPSFDRDTHELTWQPVTHAIRHETDEPTYEVTTQRGRTVEVTGNHSVFGLTKDGKTREMEARALEPGDSLLAPRRLPQTGGTVEKINVLEYLSRERLKDRRIYVYGFDEETLAELRTGEVIRKKPTEESARKRYYYRYEGTDILRDSLEQNYLEKGYLPAETVLDLGWEERAADCAFRTYQVGGETTTMPVSLAVDEALVEMIAHYISEGHAEPRQVGFTFGSHETELIEATEQAVAGVVGSTTTVQRERNSTRVKAFGSPLSMFLKSVCGDAAENKRIPGFVFDIDPELQERFIAALYRGDGSDAHPGNELSHTTTSETLARQLSVLWNIRGVVASIETTENSSGYADDPATRYRTKVYGEDVDLGNAFSRDGPAGEQAYKRIPTSLLDEVRIGAAPSKTVPDSVPGLLMGAGVGSSLEHAAVYQRLIEDAVKGEYVTEPRYVHNLKQKGLLDDDHRPTERLEDLWSTIRNLRGFTGSDMCLLPVQNVERTDPPEYVYDISVPGATGYDENFVVANDGALSVKNSRGQQGIGISAAVLYAQLTSGKPARITSKTENGDGARYFELTIDTDSNEPEIDVDESASWERPHGTRIELEMEANMRARRQLHDYIQYTAVVNPHARIEFHEPGDSEKFERATEDLPPETEQIRPHPHGVELGTLLKMLEATDSYSISGFLQGEFTRVGAKTAGGVCDNLRDRHFGRELAWRPPERQEDAEIEPAVRGAVANKRAEATAAFARRVTQEVREYDRVAHSTVAEVVAEAADGVEAEYDQTFGSTVREKAVEAAYSEVAADRTSDCYAVVDGATTTRKDDAVVDGLARRLAETFAGQDDRRNRLTREGLRGYVDRAADASEEYDDATFGETARENVTAAFWERARTVPDDVPKVTTVADRRDAAAELLEAMRETDILSPPTDCLAPIAEELVEAGLRKEYDADFYAAATRDAEVHGGDPFVVEAGVAYGGDLEEDGEVEVLRFANRVPLVYQRGACATVDVLREINWRNYGLDQPGGTGMPNGPAVLLVHVASTNVPFTSESKDAVANIPGIEDEIELALREAARELKSYLNKRRSLEKRRRKQNVIAEILPVMAEKLTEVTGHEPLDVEDSLARIMNNVLLERSVNGSTVELTVHNFDDTTVAGEVTEIVTADPGGVDDATVVEMDGEWFLKWDAEVQPGESATLSYSVEGDPDFDVSVEGIEPEKLTINA